MKRAIAALALLAPLSAGAAVVGVIRSQHGQIELHDTAGPCVGGALAATYRPANPADAPVPGCWVARNGRVVLVFFDGDVASAPIEAVRKPAQT